MIYSQFTSAKVAEAFSHWCNSFSVGSMLFHINLTNVWIGLTYVQWLLTFFICFLW